VCRMPPNLSAAVAGVMVPLAARMGIRGWPDPASARLELVSAVRARAAPVPTGDRDGGQAVGRPTEAQKLRESPVASQGRGRPEMETRRRSNWRCS
jgi:hypothetical protein